MLLVVTMRPEKEAHWLAIPDPQNDHKTFASNKYNHTMDQPLGPEKEHSSMGSRKPHITKHKTFSWNKII
jgi:hypothetical protein